MDWHSTAGLFPGQGSQALGMGADFAERYPIARDTFAQADDMLGYELSSLCWQGPKAQLDETAQTQPALYVCSVAIWRVLLQQFPAARPACLAGHSLGELSALTAAGALDFEPGLRLVAARGRYMQLAGRQAPGAMAAVLALDVEQVRELCAQAQEDSGQVVVLANDNCPGQGVVSGQSAAVDRLLQLAQAAGARRTVKLAVSIAAHSPLMEAALAGYTAVLDDTPLRAPRIPVISNVTAQPLRSASDIRLALREQLTQPVLWTDSMRLLIDAGAQTFLEIGAGNVLVGLLRRIDRRKTRYSLSTVAALEALPAPQASA